MKIQPRTAPTNGMPRSSMGVVTVTVISFSLTFVGASMALLLNLLPPRFAALPVEMGGVLLLVPVCAIVFAMMVEVLRAALGGMPLRPARSARAMTHRMPHPGKG